MKNANTTKSKSAEPKAQTKSQPKSKIIPNITFKITITADSIKNPYYKAVSHLKKNITVPGFRKGEVPNKFAEEKIGADRIIDRVLQELLPALYQKEIEKSKYKPLTQPEFRIIEAEKGKDWIIEAQIAQKPEFKLDPKYKSSVKESKAEADKHIKENKSSKKNEAGQKKQQPVKKPTDQEIKDHRLAHIFQDLVSEYGPEIPELLVKEEVRYEFDNLLNRLQSINLGLEDFLSQRQITTEDLSAQLAVEALSRIQLTLLIDAIAEEEEIKVTDKDLETQFEKIEDKKIREIQKKDPQYRAIIEQTLKRQKVTNFLLSL